ncbi:MAG: TonB C-terminal domain-containing protein [Opitutaceae bacterium]|nr:TonB C-terminal domain-containing protein [Opitutaceae bacterium]
MDSGSPRAFLCSLGLHGLVALALLLSLVSRTDEPPQKILQLVAGEGDNYMANEAPALGVTGGISVPMTKAPEPRPAPAPEPTPPAPAPAPPTPTAKATAPEEIPNFSKQITRKLIIAESKAKLELKREAAAKKKREEEERKRISKEEFDQKNKARSAPAPAKNTPTKVAKIDAEGIAKGVVGGSPNNKVGGAGGKALTAAEGDEAERYGAALLQRLKDALDRTPGLNDGLRAEAEFTIEADGRLTRARITKSSRNDAFDKAVLEAIASVRMGTRPRGVAATQLVPFSTHGR